MGQDKVKHAGDNGYGWIQQWVNTTMGECNNGWIQQWVNTTTTTKKTCEQKWSHSSKGQQAVGQAAPPCANVKLQLFVWIYIIFKQCHLEVALIAKWFSLCESHIYFVAADTEGDDSKTVGAQHVPSIRILSSLIWKLCPVYHLTNLELGRRSTFPE